MHSIFHFFRKIAILMRREKFNRELEEEMFFHRELTESELQAEGVPSGEARHAANRRFGNDARLRDQSHETVGFWFEGMLQDFRFAIRQLRKNPGFAVTAILILTLGIGASVAIFGFVDAALISLCRIKILRCWLVSSRLRRWGRASISHISTTSTGKSSTRYSVRWRPTITPVFC